MDAIIGARMGAKAREYLVRWEMEIEEGEKWETWEPYENLLTTAADGEREISAHLDEQVRKSEYRVRVCTELGISELSHSCSCSNSIHPAQPQPQS